MQFKVPQDVQRADRIVGPLTMRQLVIAGLGGGLAYSLYVILAKQYYLEIWLPPVIFISLITLMFAFYRFHDLPFEKFALFFIEYKFKPQKRTFQKTKGDVLISVLRQISAKQNTNVAQKKESLDKERLKKLSEISSKLDSHGKDLLAKRREQIEALRTAPTSVSTQPK